MVETPIGFIGAVAVINIFMEVLKNLDSDKAFNRFYPLTAEVVGVILGISMGLGWFESLFIGASAMGIYRGAKVSLMRD